jgi:hypothetical protein
VHPLRGPFSVLLTDRCLQVTVGLDAVSVAADAVAVPVIIASGAIPSNATSPIDRRLRKLVTGPPEFRPGRGTVTMALGEEQPTIFVAACSLADAGQRDRPRRSVGPVDGARAQAMGQ